MGYRIFFIIITLFLAGMGQSFGADYRFDPYTDGLWLGIGLTMEAAGAVTTAGKPPPTTDDLSQLDRASLPAMDRKFAGRWNPESADLSDWVAGLSAVAPVSVLAKHHNQWLTLIGLYAETHIVTSGGVDLAKGAVSRYRPFSYNDTLADDTRLSYDVDKSFFSGHTARTTASLTFLAKVYSDLNPTSSYISVVWSAAALGSLGVAALRVDAGRHFPSDVLVGLLWGGMVGYWVPESHRGKAQRKGRWSLMWQANVSGASYQRRF